MARCFPGELPQSVRTLPGRAAEIALFDRLQALPEPFQVFYSVRWQGSGTRGSPRDGEADFVVAHPEHGILVLEVKGGQVAYQGNSAGWVSLTPLGQARRGSRDPLRQASESRHVLLAHLSTSKGWRQGRFTMAYAVALPDIVLPPGLGLPPSARPEVMLDSVALADPQAALERVWQFWRNPATDQPLGADRLQRLVELLEGQVRLPLAPGRRAFDRRLVEHVLAFVAEHRSGAAAVRAVGAMLGLLGVLLAGAVELRTDPLKQHPSLAALDLPPGTRLLITARRHGQQQLAWIRPDGRDFRTLRRAAAGHYLGGAALEPGGPRLVCCEVREDNQSGALLVLDLASGSASRHAPSKVPSETCWLPGGRAVYFTATPHPLNTVKLDLRTGRETAVTAVWQSNGPTLSPDGQWLLRQQGGREDDRLWVGPADGPESRPLLNLTRAYAPAWSPDGSQIAFVASPTGSSVNRLYIANADGSEPRQLTAWTGSDSHPAWSPDGRWIAFSADHQDDGEIYLVRPDGSALRRLTFNRELDGQPRWWPAAPWRPVVTTVQIAADADRIRPGQVVHLWATACGRAGAVLTWPRFAWRAVNGGGVLRVTGPRTAEFVPGNAPLDYDPQIAAINVRSATIRLPWARRGH
ncbi:MAG: PD40 domain-containing protein [Fimbriimonadaceae bacterium]|nr:PD40 domain-containing protein [Fimbriimonadaceae bacterium]